MRNIAESWYHKEGSDMAHCTVHGPWNVDLFGNKQMACPGCTKPELGITKTMVPVSIGRVEPLRPDQSLIGAMMAYNDDGTVSVASNGTEYKFRMKETPEQERERFKRHYDQLGDTREMVTCSCRFTFAYGVCDHAKCPRCNPEQDRSVRELSTSPKFWPGVEFYWDKAMGYGATWKLVAGNCFVRAEDVMSLSGVMARHGHDPCSPFMPSLKAIIERLEADVETHRRMPAFAADEYRALVEDLNEAKAHLRDSLTDRCKMADELVVTHAYLKNARALWVESEQKLHELEQKNKAKAEQPKRWNGKRYV